MQPLRAATYLSPSLPVEYFEMLLHHLEQKLGVHSTLLYESRWEGPRADREDPFRAGRLELAWMSSTSFLSLRRAGSPVELLPLSAVHEHPKLDGQGGAAGYYVDVIMHKDMSEKVKDFVDLRGCKWAYNGPESLGGHVVTLANLKEMGVNSSFFGNVSYSGSPLESIRMVVDKKVDAAAVDANCLRFFLRRNPHLEEEVEVLTSWGPLPPYPIVLNTSMDPSLKTSIAQCLSSMHADREGLRRLQEFGVRQFVPVSLADYETERLMTERTKGLSFGPTYY